MKRWMKIALGICCHWFLLCVLLGGVASIMINDQPHPTSVPHPLGAAAFHAFLVLSFAVWFGTLILVAKHAMRHPRLDNSTRMLWAFLLISCLFGLPIYFWMYLWKQPEAEPFFGIKGTA